MTSEDDKSSEKSKQYDFERLLEERAKLDSLLEEKFVKQIVVMFTDLQDSTSLAESEGDLAIRLLIKRQNDIMFPIIEENDGIMVKTMGDGTLSYFKKAPSAIRAAVKIQKCIDDENNEKKNSIPIYVKIGLHTGSGIVEREDIFGDVVNVAARFVSLARSGEIFISEDTYNSLVNKDETLCRFVKTTRLKGKKDVFKVFKVFWNEIELEKESEQFSETSLVHSDDSEATTMFTVPVKYKLVIVSDKETPVEHIITNNGLVIGRLKTNDVSLADKSVSRQHARVWCEDNEIHLEDLSSRNGTLVDGKKIQNTPIKEGQEIRICSYRLYVTGALKEFTPPRSNP